MHPIKFHLNQKYPIISWNAASRRMTVLIFELYCTLWMNLSCLECVYHCTNPGGTQLKMCHKMLLPMQYPLATRIWAESYRHPLKNWAFQICASGTKSACARFRMPNYKRFPSTCCTNSKWRLPASIKHLKTVLYHRQACPLGRRWLSSRQRQNC